MVESVADVVVYMVVEVVEKMIVKMGFGVGRRKEVVVIV